MFGGCVLITYLLKSVFFHLHRINNSLRERLRFERNVYFFILKIFYIGIKVDMLLIPVE